MPLLYVIPAYSDGVLMMNTSTTPEVRKSPVQEGVELVQALIQLGTSDYQAKTRRLHQLMQRFALAEISEKWEPVWNGRPEDEFGDLSFAEWVLHEDNESEPFALAYWAATSAYFRKVYQAAAAAA